jgi:hypothetical protein
VTHAVVKGEFAIVAEWRVAEVVSQSGNLDEVGVDATTATNERVFGV